MKPFQLGISSCLFRGKENALSEENFSKLREAGISLIEVSYGDEEIIKKFDFHKCKELADKYGIELWTLHLPFLPFEEIDLSALDEKKRVHTVDVLKKYITKGFEIGISHFVTHPSAEPNKEEERAARLLQDKKSYKELAEFASSLGVEILVEDLPRSCMGNCSSDILEILSADERLAVVLDTNHLLFEDNVDFIHKVGPRIHSLHVSDYDYIDERHLLPGEGNIDWEVLILALKEVGYSGPFVYEVGPTSSFKPREYELEPKHFMENYKKLGL